MALSPSLAPLAAYRRWINWELRHDPNRPEKPAKVPVHPLTGIACSPTDLGAQMDYATAASTGRQVGFVFMEGDGLFFVDIDGCLQADGQWTPLARHLTEVFQGKAAVEISQSGKGLHIFGRASVIPPHGCRNIPLGLELYHNARFVALTDQATVGAIGHDCAAELGHVIASYFPRTAVSRDVVDWTDEGEGVSPDDDELIRIALASGKKTAKAYFDETHVPFEALWTANEDVLAKRWPATGGGSCVYDQSEADAALAAHLAYWTAKNCERIERLMQRSALVRDKWEARADYLERTIINACGTVRNVAKPRELEAPLSPTQAPMSASLTLADATGPALEAGEAPHPSARNRTGTSVMSAVEQGRFFAGCTYVVQLNKIWVKRDGTLQDKARFDVTHGGWEFVTRTDGGKTEKSAWEAYTRNQCYAPQVAHDVAFRPELPSGCITETGLLNTYIPIATPMIEGDASRFVTHLAKLFPNADDLAIAITWLAVVARNPGFKAPWWLFIQGCQGNGKTLILKVMTFVIGERYTHLARAATLAKTNLQFNGWVQGHLFVGLEEIYVNDKRNFLDEFKDIVTNERFAMERKGTDQTTGDNRINGIMLSNHRDGVPVSREDRRYAMLLCAQQTRDDLERDGMTPAYFQDLFDWFNGRGAHAHLGPEYGYKVVAYWLHHQAPVDVRFDPSGMCTWAPDTSMVGQVRQESLGHLEQEIIEQVERGAAGFAGGWICSWHLDALLATMRVRIAQNKRRQILQSLGYVPHPGLPDGRTLAPLEGLGMRPRLFVKEGHLSLNLDNPRAIQTAYSNAQANAAKTGQPITGVA